MSRRQDDTSSRLSVIAMTNKRTSETHAHTHKHRLWTTGLRLCYAIAARVV